MVHDIIMPMLGMAQDTGIIVAWKKKLGDPVKAGDILMEVETDKATVEVEAGHDGYVTALRAETGVPIPVGDVVAVVSDDPGAVEESASPPAPQPEPPAAPPSESANKEDTEAKSDGGKAAPAPAPPSEPARPIVRPTGGRILASPKARRLAQERGIALGRLIRQGVSQPIHVADLDRAGAASPQGAEISYMRAAIEATPFTDFLSWLDEQVGPIDRRHIWGSFAAASYRHARDMGNADPVVVEAARFAGADAILLENPDLSGLSAVGSHEGGGVPSIAVFDLTDTRLVEYRPAGDPSLPQLTIAKGADGTRLDIALLFDPDALPAEAALIFLDDLCARAEHPLRHLL